MGINIGDKRRMIGTWTDPNNSDAPIDPTTVTLNITKPDGTKTSYIYDTDPEVVKDSTGVYHADISLDQSGVWLYEWIGTGTAEETEEGYFTVQRRITTG